MKRISFLSLSAFIVAIAASAFTTKPTPTDAPDPTFHWFLDGSNTYVGQLTLAQIEAQCPGAGNTCARGYDNIDSQGRPVGSATSTAFKQ